MSQLFIPLIISWLAPFLLFLVWGAIPLRELSFGTYGFPWGLCLEIISQSFYKKWKAYKLTSVNAFLNRLYIPSTVCCVHLVNHSEFISGTYPMNNSSLSWILISGIHAFLSFYCFIFNLRDIKESISMRLREIWVSFSFISSPSLLLSSTLHFL